MPAKPRRLDASLTLNSAIQRLAISAMAAIILLYFYGRQQVQTEDLALGAENSRWQEEWNGKVFTAPSVAEMVPIIADFSGLKMSAVPGQNVLLWLGNSQLHAINQATKGDHTSPYWLRTLLPAPDHTLALGFSLPNANLQEHLALALYVESRIPIRGVIIPLVFDDLREDGLRDDFAPIFSAEVRQRMAGYPVGKEITVLADAAWRERHPGQENSGLEGFIQKKLEDDLTSGLGMIWPLWQGRPNLRARLMINLYELRNFVFGIKATTVRKMIRPRYARNMAALTVLFKYCHENKIPVLGYIAPIRQDVPIPYDPKEYDAWKTEVRVLATQYSASLINLESLVPPEYWGKNTYSGDVDFMHFQGKGHEILAHALLPFVRSMTLRSN